MTGCNPWSNTATNSCFGNQPGDGSGVSIQFAEYPLHVTRTNGAYNIPDREGSIVMYPSIVLCGDPITPSAGNCGKRIRAVPHSNFGEDCNYIYDYYPGGLSFDFGYSDTWFVYLYDTSNKQGIIGTPCYHYETETNTTTNNTSGETTTASGDGDCFPCSGFSCAPASTTLSYTTSDDPLTDDPDCPHPTLFGFGSDKNKLAFTYDSLSTTLPDGVTDFSLSYDGTTYADAWNQLEVTGIPYTSSQNPYGTGDETFDDFQVFEINDPANNKTGLRVKIEIKPKYDDSGASTVFQGTYWIATEILSPGTGYATNDVFALTYTHILADTSTVTLTINLKVTAVGPYEGVGDATGFDVLRAGDTINGHTITRAFHTDIDNFPYHIIYLDGNGSDFTKETQYTSNRSHVITAKAGKGIKDRAILIGMYEFLEKSIQYCTADVDKTAPDVFNTLIQPKITPTLTNGVITSVSIDDGGSGWNQLKDNNLSRDPELVVAPPPVDSGKTAILEPTFTNGVITAIEIKNGGSGYDSTDLPSIFIWNVDHNVSTTHTMEIDTKNMTERTSSMITAWPEGEKSISAEEASAVQGKIDEHQDSFTYDSAIESFTIKKDPARDQVTVLPQRMYRKSITDPLKDKTKTKYDLSYMDDLDLPTSYRTTWEEEKDRDDAQRLDDIATITQEIVPEFGRVSESFVETVQGPTSSLPHASTYTKYIIRQYRPDPTPSTNIAVTLSCTPVNAGCAHFACSAPAGSSGGTVDNGDGTSTTTTYSMSGLLGDGCKSWTASGDIKMWNDLTASTNQIVNAKEAYGNPFPV